MTTTVGSLDLSALNNLYDETQYFWFESSAQPWGAGAHVTLYPQSEFTTSTHANYLKGQNILMNTDGFSLRNGTLPMMTLDNNSLDFNVVDTTAGTFVTTATFTSTGAQIGQSGGAHSVIDADGQRFYASDGTEQLANIGYEKGATATEGATSVAPYYTFGTRETTTVAYSSSSTYNIGDMCVYDDNIYVCTYNITTPEAWDSSHWGYYIGNYSYAEGRDVIANGYTSHAEGVETFANGSGSHAEGWGTRTQGSASHAEGSSSRAIGGNSHAEGMGTEAYGYTSHAEGRLTVASGGVSHAEGNATKALQFYSHAEGDSTEAQKQCSHAEGMNTVAQGNYSHVQNLFTVATESSQTVIGRYNAVTVSGSGTDADPFTYANAGDYAFIIGNGTSNTTANRSNAFTVDWSGNTVMAGNVTVAGHSTPIGTFQTGSNTKSISTGTSYITSGVSFTLDAGVYILVGHAVFASNATGRRGLIWETGAGNVSGTSVDQTAVSGTTTRVQSVCLAHPDSSTTYTLYATQNSGSSLSTDFYVRVTRIA